MRTWCWPRPTRAQLLLRAALDTGRPRNAVRVRRLKDKLGNRSNASAEVEFEDAWGVMVGEPGRGLSVLLKWPPPRGSIACWAARRCCARRWCRPRITRHRQAFGKPLAEQPLMRNVLADLALESEASMALALRLARAVDERADPARGARGHAGRQALGLQARRGAASAWRPGAATATWKTVPCPGCTARRR